MTITTKVGIYRQPDHELKLALRSLASPLRTYLRANKKTVSNSSFREPTNFNLDAVQLSAKNSLRQLQTDYIDAYLLHTVRLEDISSELLTYLDKARDKGMFRTIGIATSVYDAKQIIEKYPDFFDIVQQPWSVFQEEFVHNKRCDFFIHGAIANSLPTMIELIAENKPYFIKMSRNIGIDLLDIEKLSEMIIGAAVASRRGGMLLVASRNRKRLASNMKVANNKQVTSVGIHFLQALNQFLKLKKPSCNQIAV